MHYVISDIHGCLPEFRQLLKLISFSITDELFLLGDYIDRGTDPLGVLREISLYPNMHPLLGNHEVFLLHTLPPLLREVDDDVESVLTEELLRWYDCWIENGGDPTIRDFRALPKEDLQFYYDFIRDMPLTDEVTVNGIRYLLIHSLPKGYDGTYPLPEIKEYTLFGRPDFSAEWKTPDVTIIGHTPTMVLFEDGAARMFRKNQLINIDCGCVFGGSLCALCLETGEAFYVPAQNKKSKVDKQ